MKLKALSVAIAAAILAAIAMAGAASPATSAEPASKCAGDKAPTTVTVGIVQMKGCWTERTTDGVKNYVADLASQPTYGPANHKVKALDMNGLLIGAVKDQDKIVVNTRSEEHTSELQRSTSCRRTRVRWCWKPFSSARAPSTCSRWPGSPRSGGSKPRSS